MDLKPFDIEVLKHLSEGKTQTEVEKLTGRTKSVIETTLKKARDKNGMNTTIELVVNAVKKNIL